MSWVPGFCGALAVSWDVNRPTTEQGGTLFCKPPDVISAFSFSELGSPCETIAVW